MMTSSHELSGAMLRPGSGSTFSNPIRHKGPEVHYSYDSGMGTMQRIIPERGRSPAKLSNPGIAQLPVRHTSTKGTQEGLLFPKYFTDTSSKCIMCKSCGIFFSHDIFLRHLHDAYGKRVECYGQCIELSADVPNKDQILTFQEFLATLSKCQEGLHDTTRVLHQQTSGSPARNATSKSPSRLNSAPANTWTQDIQETVLASEKLLKETSDYLRTSARKMQHRRRNSIQLQELPFSTKDDNNSRTLPISDKANETLPVIKNQNQHRTSKKSLQNLFITSDQANDKKTSVSSRSKSDLPRPIVVKTTQVSSTLRNENIASFSASGHDPVMSRHLTDSLQVEQNLVSRPSGGSGDATATRDVLVNNGNERSEEDGGKMTTDELATSRRREVPPFSLERKNGK